MRSPGEPASRSIKATDGRRIIKRNGKIAVGLPSAGSVWLTALALPAQDLSRRVGKNLGQTLRSRAFSRSLALIPLLTGGAQVARAQAITPLVPQSLDPVYNRGRNVSVSEQVDPNFLPLGLRLGSIQAFPSVAITTGATTNVYANDGFKRSDAFYYLQPAIRVVTDLPVHQVELIASTTIQRFAEQKIRNQEAYFVNGTGRLDIGPDATVTARVSYSRQSESPYASDLASDVSVLSQFTVFNPSLQGVYKLGRVRLTAKAEHLDYKFNIITFADGSVSDQRERNRSVDRASAQAEYALSPSIATFVQANYDVTNFPFPRLDGQPSRDSKATSVLGGLNFDLAGFARGSVAAGYVTRNYDSRFYEDQNGLILQARADFFLSPLTTIGVGAQRTLQDAASSNNGAYVDTRASVSVDHALLRNLLLSLNGTVVRNKLLDTQASSRRMVTAFSARYQTNRFISVEGLVQYGMGRPGEIPLGVRFNELSGQLTVRFRR